MNFAAALCRYFPRSFPLLELRNVFYDRGGTSGSMTAPARALASFLRLPRHFNGRLLIFAARRVQSRKSVFFIHAERVVDHNSGSGAVAVGVLSIVFACLRVIASRNLKIRVRDSSYSMGYQAEPGAWGRLMYWAIRNKATWTVPENCSFPTSNGFRQLNAIEREPEIRSYWWSVFAAICSIFALGYWHKWFAHRVEEANQTPPICHVA